MIWPRKHAGLVEEAVASRPSSTPGRTERPACGNPASSLQSLEQNDVADLDFECIRNPAEHVHGDVPVAGLYRRYVLLGAVSHHQGKLALGQAALLAQLPNRRAQYFKTLAIHSESVCAMISL